MLELQGYFPYQGGSPGFHVDASVKANGDDECDGDQNVSMGLEVCFHLDHLGHLALFACGPPDSWVITGAIRAAWKGSCSSGPSRGLVIGR